MNTYEKKYKETLERAKTLYENANGMILKKWVEQVFPELKESEDERIRQKFIKLVKMSSEVGGFALHKWEADGMLAWLEKQGESDETKAKMFLINKGYPIDANGVFPTYEEIYNIIRDGLEHQVEQKSIFDFNANNWYVSKVDSKIHNIYNSGLEPKFHKDEWVVNNATLNLCHILRVEHGQYICDDCSFPITKENEYHLWTIQDAKDGDVVVDKSDGTIGIFESIGHHPDGGSFNDPSYCFLHCRYDDGDFYADFEGGNIMDSYDAIPATKEQRDLLFQKMKEAGYTFDFEKKELKRLEKQVQKPKWSENDEHHWMMCLECVEECATQEREDFSKTIDWLKSIKKAMEE